MLTVSLNCSMLLLLQHLSGSRQPAVPWAQTSSPMSTCMRWPPYLRPAVLLNPRVYSQTPFNPTESQFLGRFLSPGVPQKRRIWNSQGGRNEKVFFFFSLYISEDYTTIVYPAWGQSLGKKIFWPIVLSYNVNYWSGSSEVFTTFGHCFDSL